MLFIQSFLLKLTYTRANGPDPDTDGVSDIQTEWDYQTLKGSAANMNWPQGSTLMPWTDIPFPGGNNLLTDVLSDEYGVRRWSIESGSRIPGKLQIAYYLFSNSNNAAPNSVASFDLDVGAWATGDLFVFTGDFSAAYYRSPRYRFIPGWLVVPLGV